MNKLPEKNKALKAFDPRLVTVDESGNYIVPKDKTRTLYTGRYCAVSGFIYAWVSGKYCVLANKRGKGTPDFQGLWNCPCGFLEGDEDSKEGIKREIMEECFIYVPYYKLKIVYVETDPFICNNGNVTIRHRAFLGKQEPIKSSINMTMLEGGEVDEVSDIAWIPLEDVDKYEWAFNHKELIFKYSHSIILRTWFKFYYKILS